jgi:hypothetical protein
MCMERSMSLRPNSSCLPSANTSSKRLPCSDSCASRVGACKLCVSSKSSSFTLVLLSFAETSVSQNNTGRCQGKVGSCSPLFLFPPRYGFVTRGDSPLSRLCWRMKVRVESAPSPGDHKASPLLCYGFASPCVHGGKGTFLSLHPEISLYVSFANRVVKAGEVWMWSGDTCVWSTHIVTLTMSLHRTPLSR